MLCVVPGSLLTEIPVTSFTLKIAGVPILVNCIHEHSREFCSDYICSDMPEAYIEITQADIDEERVRSGRELELEGLPPHDYSDAYLEILAIYRKAVAELLKFNVLLFHGSAVALDGKAYIFAAKSGTGKTTHSRLWLKNIPGCHILNGDKPLLKFTDDVIYVCGTPWMGKEKYGVNEILPLEAICLLERGRVNIIHEINFKEAFNALLGQVHITGPDTSADCIRLFGRLSEVKLYRLSCNMEDSAAIVSYEGMCL